MKFDHQGQDGFAAIGDLVRNAFAADIEDCERAVAIDVAVIGVCVARVVEGANEVNAGGSVDLHSVSSDHYFFSYKLT